MTPPLIALPPAASPRSPLLPAGIRRLEQTAAQFHLLLIDPREAVTVVAQACRQAVLAPGPPPPAPPLAGPRRPSFAALACPIATTLAYPTAVLACSAALGLPAAL